MRYRALALDYDGTLTAGGRPTAEVIEALTDARRSGRKLLLVTGRILAELRGEFGDVDGCFDMIIGENGAVLSTRGRSKRLCSPIDPTLDAALVARGIPFRRGEALLACETRDGAAILDELTRLGLDDQLVHNRAALMVLPAGVTKGTGVYHALGELGISHHDTIAVGDAENDHALFQCCELGVAVANAVPALKAHADLVTAAPAGEGVRELLAGPILSGVACVHPRRWRVDIGRDDEGTRVLLPAAEVNVLISGPSGSGKSYLAGVLIEHLVNLEYSVCVLDPEGDHIGLAELRGVVCVGGRHGLPPPDEIAAILRRRFSSVVVDLSTETPGAQVRYCRAALEAIDGLYQEQGLPHWVFIDEAHLPMEGARQLPFHDDRKGFCFISYHPEQLPRAVQQASDVLIRMLPQEGRAELVGAGTGVVRAFALDPRATMHVRHRHKYQRGQLPQYRRFSFRDGARLTGRTAGNLDEFYDEIGRAEPAVLAHHARNGDFSRWVADVIRDATLAAELRRIEAEWPRRSESESSRRRLLQVVRDRYQS